MSRLKKFTRSLFAGYLLLGANIFYTLASVPLALHYLGKAEFGLWALVSQISGYIGLIDLGMAGSVSRILIDHKDDRRNGAYGGVIQAGDDITLGIVAGIAPGRQHHADARVGTPLDARGCQSAFRRG